MKQVSDQLQAVALIDCSIVCPLGINGSDIQKHLIAGNFPADSRTEFSWYGQNYPFSRIQSEHRPSYELPPRFDTAANRLVLAAIKPLENQVRPIIEKYGPHRVAAIVGTSAAGMLEADQKYRYFHQHRSLPTDYDYCTQEMGRPALFLADYLGISGPHYAVSTACTSGAIALSSAARLIRSGLVDAAIVGGVDACCDLTFRGFAALESLSAKGCNPMSGNRDGLHLGEAAALFVMTRASSDTPIVLSGWGEAGDAHHHSAPSPTGIGAKLAIQQAMKRANLSADDLGYINLHATGTILNDQMEAAVMSEFFPQVPMSGTKPLTGHCLGAAGAMEAAFCWQILNQLPDESYLPLHVFDGHYCDQLPKLPLVSPATPPMNGTNRHILSTSYAFGGSNAALILSRR